MRSILAKAVLDLDTISKGNNTPWEDIEKYIKNNNITEPVEFDFKDINVIQPCSSNSFIKLLTNPMFYMVLHNSAKTVENISLMCVLNGIDNKVKNIETVYPKQMTAEERMTNMIVDEIMPYMSVRDDGVVVFDIYKRFDQIGQPSTVKYIEKAIERYVGENNAKDFLVYIKNSFVQPSVVGTISNMIDTFEKRGIQVEVKSDNTEIQNKIDMSIEIGKQSYTAAERLEIMKARLAINRVGILTKYKDGRAKDEFGRVGKGEKVSVRIAVFKGFVRNSAGEVLAKFDSYNSNYFYTRQHWYLEKDTEKLKNLVYDEVFVKIDELGIYNDFIGAKYHFSNAIQYNKSGTIIMYSIENNKVVSKSYTIPERIKAVFDDFGVEYEKDKLDTYIEITKRILAEYENKANKE